MRNGGLKMVKVEMSSVLEAGLVSFYKLEPG